MSIIARRKDIRLVETNLSRYNRWLRSNLDEDGHFTVTAKIALFICSILSFGLIPALTGRVWMTIAIYFPVLLYAAIWKLYPMIEPRDGVARILGVMRTHPYLYQAQYEAVESLLSICRNAPSEKQQIVENDAIADVVEVGLLFENDADLVARVLSLLSHLCFESCTIDELVNQAGIFDLLEIWVEAHLQREIFCKHVLVFMTTIFSTSDESLALSVRKRALEQTKLLSWICRMMDAHVSIARIQQWGCISIFHMSEVPECNIGMVLFREGVISQISKALMNHPEHEPINHIAFALLKHSLTKNVDNPEFETILVKLVENKSVIFRLVERSKKRFPESQEIRIVSEMIMKDCGSRAYVTTHTRPKDDNEEEEE